jgi:glucosylglycerate phosphorylase
MKDIKQKIAGKLIFLYGKKRGQKALHKIEKITENFFIKYSSKCSDKRKWLDEKDIILITYGDQIKEECKNPLESLKDFLDLYVKDTVNSVHILPFYPYSSDDGYSVTNYFKVNPELGRWEHIKKISENFNLMFDAVINHISTGSIWFKGYLKGESQYGNYFIEVNNDTDISSVARPRTSSVLTQFRTSKGKKNIWTTFGRDQADLNYKNEKVLIRIIRLLLFYIEKGARFIRLDAAGYLWKETGTECIHLKKTHKIIQLIRDVLEIAAPGVILVTETNVAHKNNISYFGNGYNEAHMVYQFPLPPLVLNAFYRGNASNLSKWVNSLKAAPKRTTFLNFLASHDGIGILPVIDILSRTEINEMIEKVKEHGGYLSYKDNADGIKSVYELNINYFDALSNPGEDEDLKIKKFICSQAILLSLAGVPGIYIHSLFGSAGSTKIKRKLQKNKEINRRSINREKLIRKNLEEEVKNPDTRRYKIFTNYKELIKRRAAEKAFNPDGGQKTIFLNKHVFIVCRISIDSSDKIVCLHNVSKKNQVIKIEPEEINIKCACFRDIISGKEIEIKSGILDISLEPYGFLWLKAIIKV